MSSVCGKLDFKGADFEISASSPTQCSNGSKLSSHAGSDESQESDGDETGYINQTGDDELALESLPLKSSDDEENDENLTTTTPVVLIPATKGSREKHGLSLRKTSVSWADDVYDPPPSIASHTRHKKPQQQKPKSKDSHRKTGKKGQKNKDSSSSRSGKNKKQASRKQHSCENFDWVTQMPIVAASS
ncbi:unnamed protein product [Brassica oleracea var. botrytis]|uniref:chromatin modification-related protein EAF7-like n=1 Tax=Brassica oleracea var. oleracea TaxID=109376 RepID=UPI0006A72344|nr:PREDICTED: chromatin modification-related protein EAF7-like [Brassica oleracea var. oleracea]